MSTASPHRLSSSLLVLSLGLGCTPMRDLDSASSGNVNRTQGGAGSSNVSSRTARGGADATDSNGSKGDGASGAGGNSSQGASEGGAAQSSTNTGQSSGGATLARGGMGGTDPAAGGNASSLGGNSSSNVGANSTLGPAGGRGAANGGRTFGIGRAGSAGRGAGFTAGAGGVAMAGAGVANAGASSAGAGGAGGSAAGGAAGSSSTVAVAPDLPDMTNPPVTGVITYSSGASWDIDGTQWPAFEIHTPTANYWLAKAAAAMVSITDPGGTQWIAYSYGFRPHRGVPNLGGCCEPGDPSKLGLPVMTTEIDTQSVTTTTHLRLVSKSVSGDAYWLVWDFYPTHVTVTVNRSEALFGFTYRGTPAGNLDDADQLILPTGVTQTAKTPFSGDVSAGDLAGSFEWVYLADPQRKSSMFLIQHADDNLPETYLVADGDSAMFTFGGQKLSTVPIRFSLGLIDRTDRSAVSERVAFVANFVGQ